MPSDCKNDCSTWYINIHFYALLCLELEQVLYMNNILHNMPVQYNNNNNNNGYF